MRGNKIYVLCDFRKSSTIFCFLSSKKFLRRKNKIWLVHMTLTSLKVHSHYMKKCKKLCKKLLPLIFCSTSKASWNLFRKKKQLWLIRHNLTFLRHYLLWFFSHLYVWVFLLQNFYLFVNTIPNHLLFNPLEFLSNFFLNR